MASGTINLIPNVLRITWDSATNRYALEFFDTASGTWKQIQDYALDSQTSNIDYIIQKVAPAFIAKDLATSGVERRYASVDGSAKILDDLGNVIMDLEAHADRHASTGDDPLPDGAIATNQIADGAVTTLKIADLNITEAKLADLSVSETKIQDGAVTRAKTNVLGYHFVKTLSPTPGIGAYGTAVDITPATNKSIVLLQAKTSAGGTFGTSENATIRLTVTFNDATIASVTKIHYGVGDIWFTQEDLASLMKDGLYITKVTVDSYVTTSATATAITTSATIYAIEI